MYQDWLKNIFAAPEHLRKRLGNLANGGASGRCEWRSEFVLKINQAPTPIDPTEKRILKARESAVAIATRAINCGGTGHKYWRSFSSEVRAEIDAGPAQENEQITSRNRDREIVANRPLLKKQESDQRS